MCSSAAGTTPCITSGGTDRPGAAGKLSAESWARRPACRRGVRDGSTCSPWPPTTRSPGFPLPAARGPAGSRWEEASGRPVLLRPRARRAPSTSLQPGPTKRSGVSAWADLRQRHQGFLAPSTAVDTAPSRSVSRRARSCTHSPAITTAIARPDDRLASRIQPAGGREAQDAIETVVEVLNQGSVDARQRTGELTPGTARPQQQTDQQADEGADEQVFDPHQSHLPARR